MKTINMNYEEYQREQQEFKETKAELEKLKKQWQECVGIVTYIYNNPFNNPTLAQMKHIVIINEEKLVELARPNNQEYNYEIRVDLISDEKSFNKLKEEKTIFV